jgi:DNA processing protein
MSTMSVCDDLELALAAMVDPRTPARIAAVLRAEGRTGLAARYRTLGDDDRRRIAQEASDLAARGFCAVLLGDERYPSRLRALHSPPPVLYCWGNLDLTVEPAVGMCGSRNASDIGLRAATVSGEEVARHSMTVVSGYAKGVDTATHLAALGSGGRTIIVLAEGINHFRVKRAFHDVDFDPDRVLVLSQFPPGQPWAAGSAMTRNGVIVALGQALIVVEAGDKGGTLAAGTQALEIGRPLFVLDFNGGTPAGNRLLIERGGRPIADPPQLRSALDELSAVPPQPEQLSFRG